MQAIRILVATDLSEAADLALREAHDRVGESGALMVCYARPKWPSPHPLAPASDSAEVRRLSDLDQRVREAVVMRVSACTGRRPDQFLVAVDDEEPYAAIVKRAEEWGAGLVIVGYRGASGLTRMLLGGVAERVVRLAHCPVLVVRPNSGTRRIVVGTDFSDPAMPAIEAAFDEARRIDGRVTVVHSLDVRWLPTDGLGVPDSAATALQLDELEADAAERLDEVIRSRHVPAARRVMREGPATALLRAAEELEADLVVVGTRGRTGLSRVLLGSVAEAVVRSAGCSVLVVRLHAGC